jgi:hypothetical protein
MRIGKLQPNEHAILTKGNVSCAIDQPAIAPPSRPPKRGTAEQPMSTALDRPTMIRKTSDVGSLLTQITG